MAKRKKIRVEGCIHGLDSDEPRNPERICYLPCVWRINATKHNNCAWMLFDYLASTNKSLTLREIGSILNTTHETVRNIEASAVRKITSNTKDTEELMDSSLEHVSYNTRNTRKETKEVDKAIIESLLSEFFTGEDDESE